MTGRDSVRQASTNPGRSCPMAAPDTVQDNLCPHAVFPAMFACAHLISTGSEIWQACHHQDLSISVGIAEQHPRKDILQLFPSDILGKREYLMILHSREGWSTEARRKLTQGAIPALPQKIPCSQSSGSANQREQSCSEMALQALNYTSQ